MSTLEKKLEQIQDLIKALGRPKSFTPVSPKTPKAPEPPSMDDVAAPQAPKANQGVSQKDPKKIAEQLKDPDQKKDAMAQIKRMKEGVKFNSGGQWSLSKYGEPEEEDSLDKVFPVPSSP